MALMKDLELALARLTFRGKRAKFYQDLAEALDDKGVLVQILQRNFDRLKARNDAEAALFQRWLDRMDDCSFADALRGTVPNSDVMILRAAEEAKSITDGLRVLALAIGATNTMRKALLRAVAEPLFVLISSFAMAAVISVVVVPMLAAIVPPSTWPLIGRWLHTFVEFEIKQGPYVLAGLVALTVGVIWSLPRWTSKRRVAFDRYVPIYTLYREFSGASFLVALAALLRTGCGLAEALMVIRRDASPWLKFHIDEVLYNLDHVVDKPAKAFATGVFSQALTDRIEDFGERSDFNQAMGKVGLDTIDKVTESVVASSVGLNLILTLLGGIMTVFVNVGVIMVANNAGDNMQQQIQSIQRR